MRLRERYVDCIKYIEPITMRVLFLHCSNNVKLVRLSEWSAVESLLIDHGVVSFVIETLEESK